jgi:hypothetical protein
MRICRALMPVLAVLLLPALLYAKQFAVVIDTSNQSKDLTASDLVKLLTLKTHVWPDGKAVTVVMRDPSAPEMQLVLHRALNMSTEQVQAFIQAHRGSFVIVDSDDLVLRLVVSTHGAVGIIDLYSLTKDVNVLKIDGKLPVEAGYLLRGN